MPNLVVWPVPAGTVTPIGISTTMRAPGRLLTKASTCCGIWKSATSSGRSPRERIPMLPSILLLTSLPCRWTTTATLPEGAVRCGGTIATARPRSPAGSFPIASA